MNANELADLVTKGHWVFDDADEATIVAALRQYAALEWLWEQDGNVDWLFGKPRKWRAELPRVKGQAEGVTPTEAINNLRAKLEPPREETPPTPLGVAREYVRQNYDGECSCGFCVDFVKSGLLEPPHEHVWDDASWILCMGGGYVRACQSQSCMEIQRADRLVPA